MVVINQRMRALEGNVLPRPYLNVTYINPHTGKLLDAIALIDTGADHCILPASYADILGHNLEYGEQSQATGISSDPINLYNHTMQIEIAGYNYKTPEIQIAFSDKMSKNPILGVKTFLSNFILTVNYPDNTFTLEMPSIQDSLSSWGTI